MAKLSFLRSQFTEPSRVFSNSGSPVKILYGSKYDEQGRLVLEEKGKENIYDFIQSFRDSVDIHVILARFQNGDTEALQKVQGFYGDFTEMPKNYAELLNTVNSGESFFNSLPVDVRSKFGHSFAEFMASVSDGSYLEKLGVTPAKPEPEPVKPEPVKEDPKE